MHDLLLDLPEIEQEVGMPVTFVPHLVPLDRGILETIYARLRDGVTLDQIDQTVRLMLADNFERFRVGQ